METTHVLHTIGPKWLSFPLGRGLCQYPTLLSRKAKGNFSLSPQALTVTSDVCCT